MRSCSCYESEPILPHRGRKGQTRRSPLREIPEAQRRAIVLHHLGGLSVAEVAHEVGAPEGTVKARLSRGRAALASLLADSTLAEVSPHA